MKFELNTLTNYTDEAVLAELQRVAEIVSGQGHRLTRERYDSIAKVHSTTVGRRFGSWQKALDRAGISDALAPRFKPLTRDDVRAAIKEHIAQNPGQAPTTDEIAARLGTDRSTIHKRFGTWKAFLDEFGLSPVALARRYTDEECYENILALWTHYGRQPVFAELKTPPSTVGPKAYIRRWGGWRAALAAFVERINKQSDDSPTEQAPASEVPPIPEVQVEVSPRSIPLSLRYRVLARDKFRCVLCGASPAKDGTVELHVDHIHPWSKGGKNVQENLRTTCSRCNLGKGASVEGAA